MRRRARGEKDKVSSYLDLYIYKEHARRTHPASQQLLWIVWCVAGRGFVRASDVCRYKKVIQLHNQLLASFSCSKFSLAWPFLRVIVKRPAESLCWLPAAEFTRSFYGLGWNKWTEPNGGPLFAMQNYPPAISPGWSLCLTLITGEFHLGSDFMSNSDHFSSALTILLNS